MALKFVREFLWSVVVLGLWKPKLALVDLRQIVEAKVLLERARTRAVIASMDGLTGLLRLFSSLRCRPVQERSELCLFLPFLRSSAAVPGSAER